jgi:hypothetical protein
LVLANFWASAFYLVIAISDINLFIRQSGRISIIKRRSFGAKIPQNLKIFSREKFLERKSSETLFILGSGPSVKLLRSDSWEIIGSNDSLALNRFAFHEFVPTFYWLEINQNLPALNYLLNEMTDKYRVRTPLFFSSYDNFFRSQCDVGSFPEIIRRNLFFVHLRNPFFKSANSIIKNCRKLESNGKNSSAGYAQFISLRASLIVCIQFAFLLNYKKIVFVGVDLNSSEHFFDTYSGNNVHEYNRLMALHKKYSMKKNSNKVHRTANETIRHNGPSVVTLIKELRDRLSDQNDIKMYVSTKQGLLGGVLPEFFN